MIVGNGIDIIEVERIAKVIKRSKGFMNRIFTENERQYIDTRNGSPNTIAGLFATKEAVSKALGTGLRGFKWRDMEIKHSQHGKPEMHLSGNARVLALKKGIKKIHISISHSDKQAIAYAIAEGERTQDCFFTNELVHRRSAAKELVVEEGKVIDENIIKSIIPKRAEISHKGDYGRVGIIAGSVGMTGAAYLASQSCLRSGSGLVYSIIPESLSVIMSIKTTEVIIKPVKDNDKGYFIQESLDDIKDVINDMDVLALGPGIGIDQERVKVVEEILKYTSIPVILDGDGINCVSANKSILKQRQGNTIITPHPGELSRLLDVSIAEIQNNRIKYAKVASQRFNVITVLKGANTIISDAKGSVYVNPTGNSGMATAGSGDVLTGIVTSFVGQGLSLINSAVAGVFIHGLAGDLSALDKGKYGMIATDIIQKLPYALKLWEG